jgi:tetratricopeptide (TPR) repeat protein
LAAELSTYWEASGRAREGLRWISAALDASPDPSAERCFVLYAHAWLLLQFGKRDAAQSSFQEATALSTLPECEGIRAELLEAATLVQLRFGDYGGAEASARQAVAAYDDRGDSAKSIYALNFLAMALLYQGRAGEAREEARRSVEIRRANSFLLSGSIDTLAQAHFELGDLDQARACWLEGTFAALEHQQMAFAASFLEGLALIAGERGKKEVALRIHHCADHLLAEMENPYEEPLAPRLKDLVDRLRIELGPERSARLQAEGEALTLSAALEMARAEG